MLILTREPAQRVVITMPDKRDVIVEVMHVRGQKVRLAFHADHDIKIMREEIMDEAEAVAK